MTEGTKPWVSACYQAIDAAAAGEDPSAAVAHLPEFEAERALAAALPIIETVAQISEKILAEPTKKRRRWILERHTKQNGLRAPVQARVRRLWDQRRARGRDQLAAARAACQEPPERR